MKGFFNVYIRFHILKHVQPVETEIQFKKTISHLPLTIEHLINK